MERGRSVRRGRDPLELLSRIVNKTSLSAKRVTHHEIYDIGSRVQANVVNQYDASRQEAVEKAISSYEQRSARELREALRRQKETLDEAAKASAQAMKNYYEKLAERVAEQRDRLEEEHLREARRRFENEKEEELRAQLERCEHDKKVAVELACNELQRQLRAQFHEEQQIHFLRTLEWAEDQYVFREQETIACVTAKCEQQAAEEAARTQQRHRQQIDAAELRYQTLKLQYEDEEAAHVRTATDFRELQTDYQRFMNYTGGMYDSDYMMKLRRHGTAYALKPSNCSAGVRK